MGLFKNRLLKDSVFALVDEKIDHLNRKIDADYLKVKELFKIGKGMETAANSVFLFKEYPLHFPKEFIRKRISGEIIKKYFIEKEKEYILYFEDVESFEDLPESIQNHLLENRADKKRRKTSKWWNYTFPMHKEYYHLNKLWFSYRAKENIFCFDDTKEYIGLANTTVIFDTNQEVDLKYLLALLNSKLLNFRYRSIGKQTGSGVYEYFENGVGKLPIPKIPKSIERYKQNIDYLLTLPKKKIYDKETKYAIGEYDGKEIYITEFLYAKNRGWIECFVGHKEIEKEYLKIVTYLFSYNLFDEVLENIKDKRKIYVIRLNGHRFFHIVDENSFLISYFVMGDLNFYKQLNRRFRYLTKPKREGGHFSILSPARPFWRHLDLVRTVYQKLEKKSITQEEFVTLVDEILEAKKQIALYKKHFDSLSVVEKIEIKEIIEKLEKKIEEDIEKIDYLTFKLYKLDADEIKLIEEKI